jgi:hypothetical protein
MPTKAEQIQQLQAQIAQLQVQLDSMTKQQTIGVAFFTVPMTQHVDELHGPLRVTFLGKVQLNGPIATTSPLAKPWGRFLLDYNTCTSTFCQSALYPTMTTELWEGQTTHYLNYDITLTNLATSSATFTVIKK